MLLLAAGAVDSFQLTEQEPGGIRIWGVCVTIRQVTTLREILQDPKQQQQKRKRSARARVRHIIKREPSRASSAIFQIITARFRSVYTPWSGSS